MDLPILFTVGMEGCKDLDGIILEYKYVYYTNENDTSNLDYKSNPLTEFALSSVTFFVLPKGRIFV